MTRLIVRALLIGCSLFSGLAFAGFKLSIPSLHIELDTRKVVHMGDVETKGLFLFKREFITAQTLPGDMVILVSSQGGFQRMGDEMIALMKQEQAKGTRVICLVEDHASSMAFNFLTNCSVRAARPRAVLMFHRLAFSGWPGGRMNAPNLRKAANELEKDDEVYRQGNAKALGLSLVDYDTYADKNQEWSARTLYEMKYLHVLVP